MRLSIVINNYNYGKFIAAAIDSALSVAWPDKEVIVVDDGSTDDSRSVISSYGDRIVAVFKPNGGQCDAVNVGVARATGEIVILLDSDDIVFPDVAERLAAAWRNGVACMQFAQYHIDTEGRRLGTHWPHFNETHTPEWARASFARTAFYDSPPTSGNAWAKWFLDQVLPLPTVYFLDDYLHNLAPFFGDIVSIPHYVGGEYRIHSSNISSYGKNFSGELVEKSCRQESERAALVNALLLKLGKIQDGQGIDLDRYWDHMHHRLMYKRFVPERYPYAEGLHAVLWRFWKSVALGDLSTSRKLKLLIWGGITAYAPRRLAFEFCRMREEHRIRAALFRLRQAIASRFGT